MGLRYWIGKNNILEDMNDAYNDLIGWLHDYDLTGQEIKNKWPDLYQDIQDVIKSLDQAFLSQNIDTFKACIEAIRKMYLDALEREKNECETMIDLEGQHIEIVKETERDKKQCELL